MSVVDSTPPRWGAGTQSKCLKDLPLAMACYWLG